MVSIKDVAKHAGFSVTTVSRVVNNLDCVSTKTQEKIQKSIEKLGYQQNIYAKSLRTNKIGFVSLIVPTLHNSFYSELADSTEKHLKASGYYLVLQCIEQIEGKKDKDFSHVFLKNMFDGIIICDREQYLLEQLDENIKIPIVALDVDMSHKSYLNVASIKMDGFKGGYEATKLLIQGGAKNLLMVGVKGFEESMNDRFQGFTAAIQEYKNDIKSHKMIYLEDLSFEESFKKIKEIFATNFYDGIFCLSNMPAVGALKAVLDMGYCVPNEVSIIGYDNVPLCEYYSPSISCVNQNVDNIGRVISQSLISMIDQEKASHQIKLPVEIIERESTRNL